ncbi:hypothetical protein [Hoeflea sp.]|uniref:hypothetical protein n=1 Tax=Hoeflea sp. TaxID=1940281 RepID=UPI003B0151C4
MTNTSENAAPKARLPVVRRSTRWLAKRRTLLATVACVGAFASQEAGVVYAQNVVPPSGGPCIVVGAIATCTGDLSAGVAATGPVIDTLNVNNLTQNLQNTGGANAIDFTTVNNNITINLDLGTFEAIATGGRAVNANVNGTGPFNAVGDITINTIGNLKSNLLGIDGFIRGKGRVDITSRGNIEGQFGAIDGQVLDTGSVRVDSIGNVRVVTAPWPGFPVRPFDIYGIRGSVRNAGDVEIISNGDIFVSGSAFATGILANSPLGAVAPRNTTIRSTGDITVSSVLSANGIVSSFDSGTHYCPVKSRINSVAWAEPPAQMCCRNL